MCLLVLTDVQFSWLRHKVYNTGVDVLVCMGKSERILLHERDEHDDDETQRGG